VEQVYFLGGKVGVNVTAWNNDNKLIASPVQIGLIQQLDCLKLLELFF